MILSQSIKHLLLFLLIFLLGAQTTFSKTELVLSQHQVSFFVNQNLNNLEKELPPNIGFLKEKVRFVVAEGVSAQNTYTFSEIDVEYLANAGGKLNLLGKLDNFTSLKTWVNGLDDVIDANLITKLNGLDVTYLAKLETDIASNSMGLD